MLRDDYSPHPATSPVCSDACPCAAPVAEQQEDQEEEEQRHLTRTEIKGEFLMVTGVSLEQKKNKKVQKCRTLDFSRPTSHVPAPALLTALPPAPTSATAAQISSSCERRPD